MSGSLRNKKVNRAKEASPYVFGRVKGSQIGQVYKNRHALAEAGIHAVLTAGIHGAGVGAYSIVVSGLYEDDDDYGEELIYTGTGGKEKFAKIQTQDQTFVHGHNKSLKKSVSTGNPVRVIRRAGTRNGPSEGYRFDGLYTVLDSWLEDGKSGFKICRYRLRKLPADQQNTSIPDNIKRSDKTYSRRKKGPRSSESNTPSGSTSIKKERETSPGPVTSPCPSSSSAESPGPSVTKPEVADEDSDELSYLPYFEEGDEGSIDDVYEKLGLIGPKDLDDDNEDFQANSEGDYQDEDDNTQD